MELWNNDTGELLCRQAPVYGGTGGFVSDKGATFDEPGYIATPPCLWGARAVLWLELCRGEVCSCGSCGQLPRLCGAAGW